MVDNNPNLGDLRQPSKDYGNMPHSAATFGNVPQPAAPFRKLPHLAERTENHTVSVREAARLFEAAGVARIERSIINWCHPNRQGVARLDCYFDENERKYYITPQSIERAISEEKAKAEQLGKSLPQGAEAEREPTPTPEQVKKPESAGQAEPASDRVKQLEKELTDLSILNAGKDYWIKQLREERDGFFEQRVEDSRRIGELETELRQLSAPRQSPTGEKPQDGTS